MSAWRQRRALRRNAAVPRFFLAGFSDATTVSVIRYRPSQRREPKEERKEPSSVGFLLPLPP